MFIILTPDYWILTRLRALWLRRAYASTSAKCISQNSINMVTVEETTKYTKKRKENRG